MWLMHSKKVKQFLGTIYIYNINTHTLLHVIYLTTNKTEEWFSFGMNVYNN